MILQPTSQVVEKKDPEPNKTPIEQPKVEKNTKLESKQAPDTNKSASVEANKATSAVKQQPKKNDKNSPKPVVDQKKKLSEESVKTVSKETDESKKVAVANTRVVSEEPQPVDAVHPHLSQIKAVEPLIHIHDKRELEEPIPYVLKPVPEVHGSALNKLYSVEALGVSDTVITDYSVGVEVNVEIDDEMSRRYTSSSARAG